MSRLEHAFLKKLGESWETATPGFCIQAFRKGKKIVDIEVGDTYWLYDWASLTKIVFTTTALMMFHDLERFKVTDRVSRWVEWFPQDSKVRIKDLLTHTAGNIWWAPFYQTLEKKLGPSATPEEAWEELQKVLKRKVLSEMRKASNAKADAPTKAVYSDIDFLLLGSALEAMSETILYTAWAGVRDRLGLEDTDFSRGNEPLQARKYYAPTEEDARRGGVLRGEVHDDNTWALKGVAPHAGLFGPIQDLSRWGLLLRSSLLGTRTQTFASPETVNLFTKRALPRSRGDWALGFMMPTKGGASCGPLFSGDSVGHTGFTGTSLWFDPKQDLLVTILSNRVHRTRENKAFVELRPKLHTWIAEEL